MSREPTGGQPGDLIEGAGLLEQVRRPGDDLQHGTATVRLGTVTDMPAIGFGTWQLEPAAAGAAVRHALEIGYRLVDTALDYGTQPQIGEVLRAGPIGRDEVFLVSKLEENEDGYGGTQRRLEEIGLGHLDLCLIHRPPRDGSGQALWRGLIEAKQAGLVREIGVSNYSPAQIDELIADTGEVPVVNQIEWSPFGWSDDVLSHARETGVVIQAYSPLTRGHRVDDETLTEIGVAHGKTPAQVLLRWNLQLGTPPIPKASRADHREENLDAFDFQLDDSEMRRSASSTSSTRRSVRCRTSDHRRGDGVGM